MKASSRRSSGPVLPVVNQFGSRSASPSDRFGGGCTRSPFASTSPSFSTSFSPSSFSSSTQSQTFLSRSSSPTRVNFSGHSQPATGVKFALPSSHRREISPSRNIPAVKSTRKTCMCAPTTHPGSFRCSLHRSPYNSPHRGGSAPPSSNRLNARRSAMTNSLIRISTVEGDLVKRALAALIRPSSHSQRRRGEFNPRPSRLSVMSKAENGS